MATSSDQALLRESTTSGQELPAKFLDNPRPRQLHTQELPIHLADQPRNQPRNQVNPNVGILQHMPSLNRSSMLLCSNHRTNNRLQPTLQLHLLQGTKGPLEVPHPQIGGRRQQHQL